MSRGRLFRPRSLSDQLEEERDVAALVAELERHPIDPLRGALVVVFGGPHRRVFARAMWQWFHKREQARRQLVSLLRARGSLDR